MRLFFAVPLSEVARAAVAGVQEELRLVAGEQGIKWVTPEQFHYTLRFLGETPETRLPAILEAANRVAAQASPFALTLSGVGAFPSPRRPQTLWIGATEGIPVLTRLAEWMEQAMQEVSFAPSEHPFRPHLTLARVKAREAEKAVAQALTAQAGKQNKADKLGVISVESFVLMESVLRSQGPTYTALETFALSAT